MELSKAIDLINPGITTEKETIWADLGCGSGLFTTALAQIIGNGSKIYAVDTNRKALDRMPPIANINLEKIVADFEKDELPFSELDGILMANSLHFVKDKNTFIKKAKTWLNSSGYFLIVEYNTDAPNRWVPYPLSFASAVKLFSESGLNVKKISEQASLYNRAGMYGSVMSNE
jgi:ubiquinone/menaquinone biosynthesis C-methylase UbiE